MSTVNILDNAAKVNYTLEEQAEAYRRLSRAASIVELITEDPFPPLPDFDCSPEEQIAWYEKLTKLQALELAAAIRLIDSEDKEEEEES